jgi:hypothetical protein
MSPIVYLLDKYTDTLKQPSGKILKRIIPLVAILAVTSLLLVPVVTVYASTSLPMAGSQWAILELLDSKIKTSHADTVSTGVEFLFPDATVTPAGFANLLVNGFTAALTTGNTLTATIQVVTSSSTTMFVGNPDGSCPASGPSNCPGTVRLYFASNLPQAGMSSCLGTNGNSSHMIVANEFDYWWSNTPVKATLLNSGSYYQFSPTGGGTNGPITLQVSLDPLNWSDLCGHAGTFDLGAFMASISNIKDLGLSFGSGFFFENGVRVDGITGSATFQLTSYTIT